MVICLLQELLSPGCKLTRACSNHTSTLYIYKSVYHYQREEYSKNQKPRGGITLQGAVVAPSDEDSVTFTIHAANGEVYRLRGRSLCSADEGVSII